VRWIASLLLLVSFNAFSLNLTARSWLVADGEGNILQGENINESRSIASITKLMTVMVVLDQHLNLNEKINQYTRDELIKLAMVKSDNNAAILLCESYPGGKIPCVKAMNEKAQQLNMLDTKYIEASGLSTMNISTATDLIKLVHAAKEYPEIVEASKTSRVQIKIKKKWVFFNNTNPIIGKRHNFIVSKTGYIKASGGCIVMMLDTEIGRRIVVVLGSKNTHTRIPEAEFIATH
jgi:D-alanyl-D-alanine endopeptidase (penicillin-binding protein 7)